MGIYLNIKKDGVSASLGISHYYKVDGVLPEDGQDIYDEINLTMANIRNKLISLASYSPKNLKEMENITEEVNEEIEYLKDEMIRYGKAMVITELKEEGFEITEE